MKIVVCVKQVPEVTDVKINRETGTLVREGVASILNPFCEYALDHAGRVREKRNDVAVCAVSMGPPQARSALLRCLELGADEAILASDRRFAGADTWATALTLASLIRKLIPDFDLVLVGKQAIDGDTAQVGPEMAEILGIPQITCAVDIEITSNGRRVRARRESEMGQEVIEARMPTLVSISKGELLRRIPSFAEVLAARRKPVQTIDASHLDLDEAQLGLQGSFTQVVRVFPPQRNKSGRKLEGLEADDAAREIVAFLTAAQFI